jgi:hypothetical protein
MFILPYRLSLVIIIVFTIFLQGCGAPTPPLTYAPDGTIIAKAIALQIEQTQKSLSDRLTTSLPETEISKINVAQLEPLYLGKLPAYHLKGSYRLTLKLSDKKTEQQDNEFDIYVQRQIEGKTWRLLKQEPDSEQWFSYSLEQF